ncbi:MAG: hypothetical protein OXI34_00945 [Chloroflexota bacterium]|nr:hypothetical protein [Chloroflexota bacterium]MDE2855085.1 hypothetical protein [Chloroflexota bacterium]MDE2947352.1 hypothetical protein [Chloroflexota bacterium]
MMEQDAFEHYIESELNMDALDELAADYERRRNEVIMEILYCLEQLKALLDGNSAHGRIPPKDRRE